MTATFLTDCNGHAFTTQASWWLSDKGSRWGATWFIMDKLNPHKSGPAVVDDFGRLVVVPY